MSCQNSFFLGRIRGIVSSLQAAGLAPYAQLSGCLRTGDDTYITQYQTRSSIRLLDREDIARYIQKNLLPRGRANLSPDLDAQGEGA